MMRLLRAIWFRLRSIFQPATLKAEFDDELNFHVDRETQENIKRGMNAEDARRTALAQFGGVERFKEGLRDEHGVRWLDDLSADVRHGVRLLRKNSLFSATVVVTLALGIGATSTIFAIVNGVLLRPLPYPSADRIVSLSESSNGKDQTSTGDVAYRRWKESARSFSALSVYGTSIAVMTGQGEPVEVKGGAATADFFSVMSTRVAFGRTFEPAETVTSGPRVVILSHDFWRNTFGADSGVLNRTIVMNGVSRRVIGVMPASFDFPQNSQYWVPLIVPHAPGFEYYLTVLGRLRDGVTADEAMRELKSLSPGVDSLRNEYTKSKTPVVMSLHERLFGSVRKPLSILLGAVGVLMLIACANVANLTLARSATRQREFAVRLALGAGRWRLIRQLLVESSILALLGGAVGLTIPMFLIGAFVKLSPSSVAGVSDIRIDGTVLAFTLFMSVCAALLFGLAPALTGVRSGTSSALAAGSARVSATRSQRTVRASLVVFEVSAALILLTGAALLSKSFARAMAVAPGFVADNVFGAGIYLRAARYPDDATKRHFYDQVLAELRSAPGVEVVSLSSTGPLRGFQNTQKMSRAAGDLNKMDIAFTAVDSTYARAVRLDLRAGRFLDATDVLGAPRAAMLTVSAANYFFPGQNAVGKSLPRQENDRSNSVLPIVVGVVADVAQRSLDVKPVPQIFLATAQREPTADINAGVDGQIIVRAALNPVAVRALFKQAIQHADPQQPLTNFYSLTEDVAKSIAPRRFNSLLINAFAGLALLLAMVGLYGLMAHSVIARTHELGIRIALGAQTDSVLQLVLRQGFTLVALGIVVGVALSFALSQTVASLLYDVPAQDPIAFIGAPVVLAVVALLACYIPARRATQISPIAALRQD